MKLGAVVRADCRGLGYLAQGFVRHSPVPVDRCLVVSMGNLARGFVDDYGRFPGSPVVRFDAGTLPEAEVRDWLDGLDCVVLFETPYDLRFGGWARDAGVRTVLVAMPEFFTAATGCDTVWAPTTWRLDLLPRDARLVPVPVESRPPPPARAPGPLRVLHVAGHRAAQDRNGTGVLAQALRLVKAPLHVAVECQDRRLPPVRGGSNVKVTTHLGGRADRWAMYAGHDLLVMPRRYGGLCMPVCEAMACGLGVVMTDVDPNRDWPVLPVRTLAGFPGEILTPGGAIEVHRPDPVHLAAVLSDLAGDAAAVAALRARASEWAAANTWPALSGLYRAELERAAVPVA